MTLKLLCHWLTFKYAKRDSCRNHRFHRTDRRAKFLSKRKNLYPFVLLNLVVWFNSFGICFRDVRFQSDAPKKVEFIGCWSRLNCKCLFFCKYIDCDPDRFWIKFMWIDWAAPQSKYLKDTVAISSDINHCRGSIAEKPTITCQWTHLRNKHSPSRQTETNLLVYIISLR